jgi:hypothetical protein
MPQKNFAQAVNNLIALETAEAAGFRVSGRIR